ncbi:hypothetical protein [Paraburkholderia sp. J67]|uniref:hypothetical protein n=1 Tax=Paraburkholderia sp. J67 TaxID=2805435 RepID=UPI002ABD8B31|nr:hypothetical protein [Paraburkholderia sp. J67]
MKQRRVPVVPSFATFAAFVALATLLGLCTPLGAQAQDAQDTRFDCKSNPHEFISSLIDEKSIDPSPSRVEANSVNAFRPVHGSRLSAFGFPIYVVLGYARDDTLFHRGAGKEIKAPLYGVVVSAPADSVRSRVSEANSDATVKSVVPLLLTAIVCGG